MSTHSEKIIQESNWKSVTGINFDFFFKPGNFLARHCGMQVKLFAELEEYTDRKSRETHGVDFSLPVQMERVQYFIKYDEKRRLR